MSANKESFLKKEIIATARELASRQLIVAKAGNLSARINKEEILITATGVPLARLKPADILKVNLLTGLCEISTNKKPSSELTAHCAIYNKFPYKVIIHCHPPLTNAYFSIMHKLITLTYETRFYLKELPVIEQESLTVKNTDELVNAFLKNNIVVVRHHGVFCAADSFSEALQPILILEEAVKIIAIARIFKRKKLDIIDEKIKEILLK
ncbi:MAG: class II aldolase/adducin family protein [Candidatus Omnitrophica bacterium]|nr:class II aldolase/adducin family protein [Candidatus Omnitrophota bacterium]